MNNAETVRNIYAAFARGDIPAILELLADDVEWEFAYRPDHEIPWLRRRRGREGAAGFFQSLAADLEFTRFDVLHILGDGPVVVALASLEMRVKATGRIVRETEEAHVWHFDARGRVARFRHAADTWQHRRAMTG